MVDLDIVEPFYTLRPLKVELEKKGLEVLAWETSQTMGLGEAGSIIKPETRWALRRRNDVILDIGYGVEGAKTLNIIEDAKDNPDLKIFAVVNIARPMTGDKGSITEYLQTLGVIHGIINNSHLGDETDEEIVQEGARIITNVANELGIQVIATTADEKLKNILKDKDNMGNKIWYIKRFMNRSFW